MDNNIRCDLRKKSHPFYFHPYKSPNLNIEQNAERESLQSSSFTRVYKVHLKYTRQRLLCRRQAKDYLLVGCIRQEKSKTTLTFIKQVFMELGEEKLLIEIFEIFFEKNKTICNYEKNAF